MPRIVRRQYSAEEFDSGQHFAAGVGKAGQTIREGITERYKLKAAEEAADQRYQVDLKRAEATLAREQRIAALAAAKSTDDLAEKARVIDKITDLRREEAGLNFKAQVRQAIRSPGGVLGPHGLLNPRRIAGSLKSAAETSKKLEGDIALAGEMLPETARRFLTDRRAEHDKEIKAIGFEQEAKDLQDALSAGVLEPELEIFRGAKGGSMKAQPPSAQAIKTAQELTDLITGALNAKQDPGEVSKRLAVAFDKHRQLRQRAKDWEKADVQAVELLDSLEKIQGLMQGPGSNPELLDDIREKVATAKGEWARTEPDEFRYANDPFKTLGALQGLIFESRGLQGGDIGETTTEATAARLQEERRETDLMLRTTDRSMRASQGLQEAPGGGQRPSLLGAGKRAEARAAGKAEGKTPRESRQLAGLVQGAAQEALQAGTRGERAAAMERLRLQIADDLGLDPRSPEVRSMVREELSKAFAKPKKATPAKKAKTAG